MKKQLPNITSVPSDDFRQVLSTALDKLSSLSSENPAGSRLFFPNGIELIKLTVKVGAPTEVDLTIAGPKPAIPPMLNTRPELLLNQIDESDTVLTACKAVFDATKNACNKFVNAVVKQCAAQYAFPDTYLADDIVGALSSSPWTAITQGDHARAVEIAKNGNLVIGGLKSGELGDTNGHVLIIDGHARTSDGTPFGSWGTSSTKIQAAIDDVISKCFRPEDRKRLHYGYVKL